MKKSRIVKVTLILMIAFIVMACNLPFGIGSKNKSEEEPTAVVTKEPFSLGGDTKQEIDSRPVGLQEGLGSFDSYKVTIFVDSHNSTGQKSEMNETIERSVIDKNSHTITIQTSFDPENDTEESTSTSEEYVIGNITCSGSDEDWSYSEMTDQDKELTDIFKNMVDVIPLIENPEFIGEENVNGVDCNHFSFKVNGIGDSSGSVATVNSGDYWLAKDGQYIVKYHLVLEVQSAAEGTTDAKTSNIEVSIDLSNINVPITFTMPELCVPSEGE